MSTTELNYRLTTRETAQRQFTEQHASGLLGVVTFECECTGDATVADDDLTTYIVLFADRHDGDYDQCLACGRCYAIDANGVTTWHDE